MGQVPPPYLVPHSVSVEAFLPSSCGFEMSAEVTAYLEEGTDATRRDWNYLAFHSRLLVLCDFVLL